METKELLDRAEYTIDYQRQEIDRLRSEVQRLTDLLEGNGLDAHTCLRNIYTNPAASEANRLKAAASAINFEKGKRPFEPAPLELVADKETLEQRHSARLARDEAMQLLSIEERAALIPGVSGRNGGDGCDEPELPANGNGSDSSDSS